MKSDAINELAAALAKAQAKITGAVKNASNPHFRSSYANLESVWEALREPLSSNGLAVLQTTAANGDTGTLELITTLVHSSGQWIEGRFPIRPVKQVKVKQGQDVVTVTEPSLEAAAIGSATSYARRIALAAICGVYQTDDDAEAATSRGAVVVEERKAPAPAPKVAAPIKPANAFANFGGQNGKQ